jgi:predicted AAA+ superfamily ATPase
MFAHKNVKSRGEKNVFMGGYALERSAYQKLVDWKNSYRRKPLILNGARQVGKTWLLKEFGQREYDNIAYISCDNNPVIQGVFTDFDVRRLIRVFSALTNEQIKPEKTLIILDEVQEVQRAVTSLKYFSEDAPQYHIAVAGSLLGVTMHTGTGYPVGKVNEITLFPMTFMEFLKAMHQDLLIDQMKEHQWKELCSMSSRFEDLLRQYYYTGGMPEAVACYIETQNLLETRAIQKRILNDYNRDFSKHIPASQVAKVRMVWNSIPSQLAKENKKFIYSVLKKGGRAKEFEDAIQWLEDAGLICRVNRVKKVAAPLKFYEDFGAFKLFMLDLGLLGAMSDVQAKDILIENSIFSEYKGAFTEQYAAQQMISTGEKLYYYSKENSTLEIDFLLQKSELYPIEVKAEENVRAKSLRQVVDYNPGMTGWRFSMSGYVDQEWMVNIPLYFVEEWVSSH